MHSQVYICIPIIHFKTLYMFEYQTQYNLYYLSFIFIKLFCKGHLSFAYLIDGVYLLARYTRHCLQNTLSCRGSQQPSALCICRFPSLHSSMHFSNGQFSSELFPQFQSHNNTDRSINLNVVRINCVI